MKAVTHAMSYHSQPFFGLLARKAVVAGDLLKQPARPRIAVLPAGCHKLLNRSCNTNLPLEQTQSSSTVQDSSDQQVSVYFLLPRLPGSSPSACLTSRIHPRRRTDSSAYLPCLPPVSQALSVNIIQEMCIPWLSQPATRCRDSLCGSPYKRWPKPELQEPSFKLGTGRELKRLLTWFVIPVGGYPRDTRPRCNDGYATSGNKRLYDRPLMFILPSPVSCPLLS